PGHADASERRANTPGRRRHAVLAVWPGHAAPPSALPDPGGLGPHPAALAGLYRPASGRLLRADAAPVGDRALRACQPDVLLEHPGRRAALLCRSAARGRRPGAGGQVGPVADLPGDPCGQPAPVAERAPVYTTGRPPAAAGAAADGVPAGPADQREVVSLHGG